jgi:adenine-specific DNA-methyltransferase
MDVNYGLAIKWYLLDRMTLLLIQRFDPGDLQFADALVSSAIVCLRNTAPPADHSVIFTFGGTLAAPQLSKQCRSQPCDPSRNGHGFRPLDKLFAASIPRRSRS